MVSKCETTKYQDLKSVTRFWDEKSSNWYHFWWLFWKASKKENNLVDLE